MLSIDKKNTEAVSLVSYQEKSNNAKQKNTPAITIDDDEAWKKFFDAQNNLHTNSTNTKDPKRHIHTDNSGMFRYTAEDENKYNGKHIVGKVADKVKETVIKLFGDAVKSVVLKESKTEEGKIIPAARVILSDTKVLNITEALNDDVIKKYNLSSITVCLPDENKTRGLRCRVDENGVRIYEVANGSYDMDLSWSVEGEKCEMKIRISDNGSVEFIESNGVTWDQLAAHKEVKVGRQYEAKPLYEALSYLKKEGSEVIKALTSLESIQVTTGVNRQAAI